MKSYSTKKTFYKIFTSNHFWIRIVRPERGDNNPPHRDCYFNRNKRLINIYAPIAGSNENSSLPLVPGSHYWSEDVLTISKGKTSIGNVRFTNPAIVACKNGIKMITPNPKYGDCIVFTPYLIHGGGKNFNCDTTRVSLEMRFWPV
jgi:ectoine hydroxylase-related dioxygenase (phytanoyl-CoA dioxygenase family)